MYLGVVVVAKYLLLFSLTGEAIKQFIDVDAHVIPQGV